MTRLILDHPRIWLAGILILTLGFGIAAVQIDIDPSVERMFLQDDPDLVHHHRVLEDFGSDELVIVRLRAPRLYTRGALEVVREISDRIEDIAMPAAEDGGERIFLIDRVVSLTHTVQIRGRLGSDGEAELDVSDLVPEMPDSREEEQALWRRTTGDTLLAGYLVSPAAGGGPDAPATTLILATIVDRPGDLEYRAFIEARVAEILDEVMATHPGLEVELGLAGASILRSTLARLVRNETIKADVLSWVLNFLILLLIFRSVPAVAFPLVAVGCGAAWTAGAISLTGSYLNPLSIVILPLIKIVGVSTAVHFFSFYFAAARNPRHGREAAAVALRSVIAPCFLASLTTAIGFAALLSSRSLTVREVGGFAAWGVLATWLLTITLVPILTARRKLPDAPERALRGGDPIRRWLDALGGWVLRRRRAVLAVGAAAAVVVGVGIARLNVATDILEYVPDDHPFRRTFVAIADEIGPFVRLQITLRAEAGMTLEDGVLQRVERIQEWLSSQPEVVRSRSIVDLLKRMNQEMELGRPEAHRLPSGSKVADLLFLYDNAGRGALTAPFVAPTWEDANELRIMVRISTLNTAEITALIRRIEGFLAAEVGLFVEGADRVRDPLAPGEVAARVSGVNQLYAKMAGTVVEGQTHSLVLAVVAIWLMALVLLRSFSLGTLAMIPNLLPTLAILGIMGFLGIRLSIATAMISAICVGIAVDDTIHFLASYRRQLRRVGVVEEAIRMTFREVGLPIVLTSVVVIAGFVSIASGDFNPLGDFALLSSASIGIALLGDLVLLPALLATFARPGSAAGG